MRLVAVVVAVLASTAMAFPIQPQTLWELSRNAELIVVARVDRVTTAPAIEDDDWDRDLAVLDVEHTLKGTTSKQVEVRFAARMTCPAPAVYRVSEIVIAFLSQENGHWYTTALSYGTRYADTEAGRAAIIRSVEQALKIQRIFPAFENAPTTWALAAVESPDTRWDGLYSLNDDIKNAHSDPSGSESSAPRADELLQAIEVAFLKQPSFDKSLPTVLKLLASRPNARITTVAVDVMDVVMRDHSDAGWAEEALDLLEKRLVGSGITPKPSTPILSFEERLRREAANLTLMRPSGALRAEARQSRWDELKQRYQLTPKVREDAPPRSSRTGGR